MDDETPNNENVILEPKSKELRKSKEIEAVVNDYISELEKSGELVNVFQFTKEMANIVLFLAENDKDGTLFNFVTDYLDKMMNKGKNRRQEKGL
ncbi:MAG: hypothetical protein ACXVHY_08760 [Methanobacterium sp.]